MDATRPSLNEQTWIDELPSYTPQVAAISDDDDEEEEEEDNNELLQTEFVEGGKSQMQLIRDPVRQMPYGTINCNFEK